MSERLGLPYQTSVGCGDGFGKHRCDGLTKSGRKTWPSRCAEAAGQGFRARIATEDKRPIPNTRMRYGVSQHASSRCVAAALRKVLKGHANVSNWPDSGI